MRSLVALALCSAALTACSHSTPLASAGEPSVVTQMTQLPQPSAQDTLLPSRPYLISPLDKLSVNVFGIDTLSGEFQVGPNGRINLPLVGGLDAAGKTPEDLSATIAAALRNNYVRDPRVNVALTETASQSFSIDGSVTEPGAYQVLGNTSLMRAVARAKGVTENARLEDVVVFRTVDGKSLAALYNLGAIRRGVYEDPAIYPNDVIVVGDSKARRLFRDVLTAVPAILTPVILLLR